MSDTSPSESSQDIINNETLYMIAPPEEMGEVRLSLN
jgi:hypothetical protein